MVLLSAVVEATRQLRTPVASVFAALLQLDIVLFEPLAVKFAAMPEIATLSESFTVIVQVEYALPSAAMLLVGVHERVDVVALGV